MLVNSLAKQNFSRASEDAVNQQIQLYRMAQQTYLATSAYFDQSGIALPVTKFSKLNMKENWLNILLIIKPLVEV
ncbi:hypothetical protein G6F56_009778 [Rhizopus delemar]|nr:hypothetical protein G6F56_009778 [Rhizopus delemar]